MAEDRTRNDDGTYETAVSDDDLLAIFAASDDPFLTVGEVSTELPISRQATYRRLEALHSAGIVERKSAGARSVGWWVNEAYSAPDETPNANTDEIPKDVTESIESKLDAVEFPW